jgi:hypothetical protein
MDLRWGHKRLTSGRVGLFRDLFDFSFSLKGF